MFSNRKSTEGEKKREEDSFDRFSYQYLDDILCFYEKDAQVFDNIDTLVDKVLPKGNVSSSDKQVESADKVRFFDRKRSGERSQRGRWNREIYAMGHVLSVKKLFALIISFILLFAALSSAASFIDSEEGVSVSIDSDDATNSTVGGTNITNDLLEPETLDGEMFVNSTNGNNDTGYSENVTFYNDTTSDMNNTNATVDDEPVFDNTTLTEDQNETNLEERGNRVPLILIVHPLNASTDVPVIPQLNITISDPDGDLMNITWYSNCSGMWEVFGTNVSVDNGSYYQTDGNFSGYNVTYHWYVSVSDGVDTNNSTVFYFTTEAGNVTNLSSGDVISDSGYVNISVFEAKAMIDSNKNITVFDVRSSEEYSSGYIDDAISIPLIDLSCESCIQKMLEEHKEDNIIVYCKSGIRSKQACDILLEHGFTTVYNLVGGIDGWIDAGFPLTVVSQGDSVYSMIDEGLNNGMPVFVFFYMTACGHCQDQMPIINELNESYSDRIDFIYVDKAVDPEAFKVFGVTGYPTMFLVVDKDEEGYVYKDFSGFIDKNTLINVFDTALDGVVSGYGWWHGNITFHHPLGLPLKVAARISHGEDAQVIIQFSEGSDFTAEVSFLESLGFVKTAEIPSKRFVAGIMTPGVFESIKYSSDIVRVYPDINFTVFLDESLPLIRYDEAVNEFGVTGSGKKICILDTGVDGSLVNYSYGYDFVNDDPVADDELGHGTSVASVIKSVAPDADLLVAKVIGGSGIGFESDVLEGLEWCIAQSPDVISFSIGSQGTCSGFCDRNLVADMANSAVDNGVFVVAASGNNGTKNLTSPACGSKVFSVGATDDFGNIAGFSNVNPTLDMFAPGVDIETGVGGGSGTSFSAPFVSGAALLVLENESLSPVGLKYRLRSTGKPINYIYNETLNLEIARLDVYNALANNTTMVPFDYSWWWQSVLRDGEEYGPLQATCTEACENDCGAGWAGECEYRASDPDDCPPCVDGCEGNEFNCFTPNYYCICREPPNDQPQQSSQKIWNSTTSTEWNLDESPTGVSLTPTSFNVTISDSNGDKMNITIKTNESGSWTVVNQTSGSGLSDGTYNFTNTSWVDTYNTKYWISFNVTDGQDWSNQTYYFTTTPGYPTQYNQRVWDGTNQKDLNATYVGVPPVSFNVTISDPNGDKMNITIKTNESGSWTVVNQTSGSGLSNGTYNFTNTSWVDTYNTKYWISFNVTDDTYWTNETYHFTTEAINTSIDTITPYNITSSPLNINATGPSNLGNVTLWYRYSTDNSSWANDPNWWNNWTYRKKLTIDHDKVAGDLTNFPILVSITDTDLADAAQDDGDDIVFTNATGTKLNHEIELFDGITGELIAWVNVTSLSGSTDTEIYMYYGNSTCNSQQNVAGTWDSNFTGVYHMNESSGDIMDSTGNQDGTAGGTTASYQQPGKIGYAIEWYSSLYSGSWFNITNDIYKWADDDFTIEVWSKLDATEGYNDPYFYISDKDYDPRLWFIRQGSGGPSAGVNDSLTTYVQAVGDWSEEDMNLTWRHVAFRNNNTVDSVIFQDGKNCTPGTSTAGWNVGDGATHYAMIGTYADGSDEEYNGVLDEIRISDTDRSNNWINTTFNTTSSPSTFLSTGNEEAWMQWNNANNPDTDYASGGWNWSFDFPNGSGYYEFYSIGKKSGSPNETAPSSADAICYYYGNTSFNLNRTTWPIGTINLGANTTTTNINLTHTGDVTIDIQIKADNATNTTSGFKWNLTDTPAHNNFTLQYNKTIGGGSWTTVTTSYATFHEDLAEDGYVTFDLKIFMATTSDDLDPMSFNITLKSVKA